ncbi:MAG TPA: DUF3459 domain-containing protein, partial [Candidatus Binatia bacterium]|nr:DUF3459 domain-containing protein [Candidatus Binatia bacterium]
QEADSVLALYRRLIALRSEKPALHSGAYGEISCDEHVLSYGRQSGPEGFLIVLNFTGESRTFAHADLRGRIILTTALDRNSEPVAKNLLLPPNEGVIIEIDMETFQQRAV